MVDFLKLAQFGVGLAVHLGARLGGVAGLDFTQEERESLVEGVNKNLDRVYAGLRPPALRRYGETDNREEELI